MNIQSLKKKRAKQNNIDIFNEKYNIVITILVLTGLNVLNQLNGLLIRPTFELGTKRL